MNRAFFLDRDGTINVDYNYVHKPSEWTWCDGAIKAIQWMNEQNYKVIVVTNQSGVVKGKYSMEQVNELHDWVDSRLEEQNAHIDAWYVAPYHPEFEARKKFNAEDRKPGKGMFRKAIAKYNINPQNSFMAGDKMSDLKPAVELGITAFAINSRHQNKWDSDWLQKHGIKRYKNIGEVISELNSTS